MIAEEPLSSQDGSLIKSADADPIYVMQQGQKRWIPDPETFHAYGFDWGRVQVGLARALDAIPTSSPLPSCRNGSLIRIAGTDPIYVMQQGQKKPTVVHFSGHGSRVGATEHGSDQVVHRDVVGAPAANDRETEYGLYFQDSAGHPRLVPAGALKNAFGAAAASVKLVVLNACYSETQADALLEHVDCVVGMSGSIRDDSARAFAVGFYGGLGERESIAAAYEQGCAAIGLEGLSDEKLPRLKARAGVDPRRLILDVERR